MLDPGAHGPSVSNFAGGSATLFFSRVWGTATTISLLKLLLTARQITLLSYASLGDKALQPASGILGSRRVVRDFSRRYRTR